ncbi:MAG: DoxX family protein [Chlorobiaceae bacterium]|nr:DoxX family protein [Chlorobiaceae bacterium]NTV26333.1 DoxX family protein [Chlorobiaceae bacterium]
MTDFEWKGSYIASHRLKTVGVVLALIVRYLYTSLFLYGFVHKIIHEWMWTGVMAEHFTKRLGELKIEAFSSGSLQAHIASLQATYLQHFAIPLAMPVAWIVTIGELIIGVCLFIGLATRANAAFGLFLLLNFAAGGYYNLTIPPLVLMSLMMMVLPTGHWLGVDRKLNEKYPDSPWFR